MIERKVTHHSAASATATGAVMNCTGLVGALVQITGTFVATVTFQGTIDGSNWVAIRAENPNTGTVATTATAAGMYYVPFAGTRLFRANMSWTSGTSITATSIGVGSPPSHPFATITTHDLYRLHVGLLGRGRTFFVDTELGASTNSGLEPNNALDSITDALALCTADRRDTIYILDWQTDNDETWPLPMSVAGVSLVGMPSGVLSPGQDSMARIICPDNTAVIALSAHYCRIMQCYIQCPAAYDAITFSSTPAWTGIIGNFFQTCKDAIGGGAAPSTSIGWLSEISHNTFSQPIADHGIYQHNPSHLLIKNNEFLRVQGTYAIEIVASGYARILDNTFGLNSDTQGAAIYMRHATTGCQIHGNRANFGITAMSANPYIEGGAAVPTNDWGLNYYGITAVMPVSV